jgi:hypothetical protein
MSVTEASVFCERGEVKRLLNLSFRVNMNGMFHVKIL